jgi:hypothetical protein
LDGAEHCWPGIIWKTYKQDLGDAQSRKPIAIMTLRWYANSEAGPERWRVNRWPKVASLEQDKQ